MRRQTGRWTDDTHKQCVCGWVGEWVVKERKEKSERARERERQPSTAMPTMMPKGMEQVVRPTMSIFSNLDSNVAIK